MCDVSNEKKELTGHELHAIEYLAALDYKLMTYKDVLEGRLKSVPDLWRQYRIAESAIDKVIRGLYDTCPEKTLTHLRKIMETGQVIIRPKPVAPMDDPQIIPTSVLETLVNVSMVNECSICMREGKEVKKCALRKALMLSAPPTRLSENDRCIYAKVAETHELGKYV